MRAFTILAITATLLAGLLASHQAMAQSAATLDGWRQFKFGMSADQARALPPPGQPWKYMPPSFLISNGLIKEFGSDFDSVSFGFTAGQGLNVILMMATVKNESTEDCKKSFQMLLTALEARYGSFAPGYRAVSGAEVRSLLGAQSQYQYAVANRLSNGVGFWADARRVVGKNYAAVSTTHMTGGACVTMLWLDPHNPVAPNAPAYRRSDGSYGRPDE